MKAKKFRVLILLVPMLFFFEYSPLINTLKINLDHIYLSNWAFCFWGLKGDCNYLEKTQAIAMDHLSILDQVTLDLLKGNYREKYNSIQIENSSNNTLWVTRFLNLAMHLQKTGKTDKAINSYKLLLSVFPAEPNFYQALGSLYTQINDYENSKIVYERALVNCPGYSARWYFFLGVIQYRKSDWKSALDYFNKAYSSNQRDATLDYSEPIQVLYYRGEIYLKIGEVNNALTAFMQAVQGDAGNQWTWPTYAAYLGEGDAYLQLGQGGKALSSYNTALYIAKEDAQKSNALSHIAHYYSAMGRPTDAIQSLNEAIAYNSNDPWLFVSLGDAYYQSGEISKSISAFKQALKISPDLSYAAEQLKLLSSKSGTQ
jgi:tetratricopeptide (TPR) repeat protein